MRDWFKAGLGPGGIRDPRWPASFIAASLLLLGGESHATTVKAMSLVEKTEASPVVVHALVERVEAEWLVPEASVRTRIVLSILESIKGGLAVGEKLTVFRGGGTIGELTQTAPGLSHYAPGEEVILFLEPLAEAYVEIGIGIGKYEVRDDGREKWVHHDPKVAAVRFSSDRPMQLENVGAMVPEKLQDFLKRVRGLAQGHAAGAPRLTPKKGAVLRPAPVPVPISP